MVEAKNVTWDVCDAGAAAIGELGPIGMLEPIDYSVVDKSKTIQEFIFEFGVYNYLFSFVTAWDTKVLVAAPTLVDFFDNQAAIRELERERSNSAVPPDVGGSVVDNVSVATREVLEWGTIDNARALKLDHRIGSLTPGKQADLIIVRRDGLHVLPAPDPAQILLHFAQNAGIETVIIGGRIAKQKGRLAFAGVDRASRDIAALADRLLSSLPAAMQRRCALGPS
jgi:hypothetical protein